MGYRYSQMHTDQGFPEKRREIENQKAKIF
jgi:hypothetical protein